MGILVNIVSGKFVEFGDIGNLFEYLNALNECGEDTSMFRIYSEDGAYGEVA